MRLMIVSALLYLVVFPLSAAEPDRVLADLRSAFSASADDSDSINPIVRMWSFLELVPAAGKVTSVYVPSDHTAGNPSGPARVVFLPPQIYETAPFELLRRQLSSRLSTSPPPPGSCSGGDASFTDCCTNSPTLVCVEDARTLSPETTLPALRATLFSATALDLVALELRSNAVSFSAPQTRAKAFSANELFLYVGIDEVKNGNSLFLRLDSSVLSKISLLIRRLERQISAKNSKLTRLNGNLSCKSGRWRSESSNVAAMLWLSGNKSIKLRGSDKPSYLGQALAYNSLTLTISFKESFAPNSPGTLFEYYNNSDGKAAVTSCMGPEVAQTLEGAKPLISFLKSPEVSAFTVAWLGLAGTISLLVD